MEKRNSEASLAGGRTAFKVGDKAVYPAHGVGEVTAIEDHEISGMCQQFYILRILDNGMKIMIPTNNVRQVGLREVIGKEKVAKGREQGCSQGMAYFVGNWQLTIHYRLK